MVWEIKKTGMSPKENGGGGCTQYYHRAMHNKNVLRYKALTLSVQGMRRSSLFREFKPQK